MNQWHGRLQWKSGRRSSARHANSFTVSRASPSYWRRRPAGQMTRLRPGATFDGRADLQEIVLIATVAAAVALERPHWKDQSGEKMRPPPCYEAARSCSEGSKGSEKLLALQKQAGSSEVTTCNGQLLSQQRLFATGLSYSIPQAKRAGGGRGDVARPAVRRNEGRCSSTPRGGTWQNLLFQNGDRLQWFAEGPRVPSGEPVLGSQTPSEPSGQWVPCRQ